MDMRFDQKGSQAPRWTSGMDFDDGKRTGFN